MSQLLINSISLISRLCGCLVSLSTTKISLLSYVFYIASIIQTFGYTASFLYCVVSGKSFVAIFSTKHLIVFATLGIEGDLIIVVKNLTKVFHQLVMIIEFWRNRNFMEKIMAEAKVILKIHQRHGRSVLTLKDCYCTFIYPVLLIVRLTWIISNDYLKHIDLGTTTLFDIFYLWSQVTIICIEGQFAVLASIVETALIDINQRIEEFAVEVGDHYLADCHLGENYLHPFFQYQEIIPSLPINIRSSLINFQLNKRSPNQGTSRAAYEQYSDSMGGLNCQLLPPREEIRNRRDAGVFDPFLDSPRDPGVSGVSGVAGVSGAFKAIEEEKQPARNQFATESKPAPLHLFNLLRLHRRLRISGKISPPKLRDMKSTPITVGSKDKAGKRCEMRELTKQHSRVARLAADLSTSFKTRLTSNEIYFKVNSPLNLYMLVCDMKQILTSNQRSFRIVWNILATTAFQLIRFLNVCQIGQAVILESEKIRNNLLALSRGRYFQKLVQEVELFLTQVELSPIEFKAGFNTRIDMAWFFSSVISVATSLIIITQFSAPNSIPDHRNGTVVSE